jgi:hypothetical protein
MLVADRSFEFDEIPICWPGAGLSASRHGALNRQVARKRLVLVVVVEANVATNERVRQAA